MPVRKACAAAVALACYFGLAFPPTSAGEGDGPALFDTWVRDERESDDAAETIDEALGARGGVRFHAPSGAPRGGRVGFGGPGARGPLAERLDAIVRGLEVLRIERRGDLIEILDANRYSRLVFIDGRPIGDGLGGETTARLYEDGFEIVTRSDDGQRVDSFRVAGDRLELVTELQGVASLPDLTLRTVYERAPERTALTRSTRSAVADLPVVTTARVAEQGGTPDRESDALARLPAEEVSSHASTIRALPPETTPGEPLRGRVEIQTLTIDPAVATVELWLDGELVARRKLPPFEATVELADPPREQTVRVVAYDGRGRRLGEDEIVLNRRDPPFRVRLAAIEGERSDPAVTVTAEVTVPRKAELARLTFFLDEREVAAIERPESTPFVAEIPTAGAGPQSFVRVVATLADGRELEDVELLEGGELREEIDVHLVQLQVLVTDRSGTPVAGLTAEDFRVVDGGESREIERLYLSRDVALVLGLAIDSSESMGPLWRRTRGAAERFLDATLGPRDRAFLVDFDDHLRLLQPLTGERSRLYAALGRLQARGGTALYDSILFSMLQFESEPGRRALVVLTDGYDSGSRADPSRAIDFGRRLGVPVYVVALGSPGASPPGGGALRGPRGRVGGFADSATARSNLRLITDPTGGRLFQVARAEQIDAVFAQIEAELRNQYVLTFYADRTPDGRSTPEVVVEGKGLDVKTVVPLDLVD